ncbi:hypothetical protein [Adlercreutzia sp. ZJ138]|uniref:hypothetical protein n=1 Tax=Adlercreutzia sp. ZJ138 TaxID=2709405 RepID=UPI0013EE2B1A|nr:hypothetical protein [Adlercreutzia sp. ZJ138]
MISIKIYINASGRECDISPADCDYFEQSFDDVVGLVSFIDEQTAEPMRTVEHLSISVDGGEMIDAYDICECWDGPGIDEWEFTEQTVTELIEDYRKRVS